MKELTEEYEQVFHQLGQRLGHQIAGMVVRAQEQAIQRIQEEALAQVKARSEEAPTAAPTMAPAAAAQVATATQPAKILPGLAGRRRRPGEPPPKCGNQDCDRPSRTRGYCQTHYVQWLKAGKP